MNAKNNAEASRLPRCWDLCQKFPFSKVLAQVCEPEILKSSWMDSSRVKSDKNMLRDFQMPISSIEWNFILQICKKTRLYVYFFTQSAEKLLSDLTFCPMRIKTFSSLLWWRCMQPFRLQYNPHLKSKAYGSIQRLHHTWKFGSS